VARGASIVATLNGSDTTQRVSVSPAIGGNRAAPAFLVTPGTRVTAPAAPLATEATKNFVKLA
jgi:hypothetical protein